MVLSYKRKQQKNRSFIPYKSYKLNFGHSGIIATSSGFLSDKTLNNFFIIARKIFKNFKSISKFWIFLNTFYIVTRKALNVRMGKGKGSRKGLLSLVHSGSSILELKYCRLGLFLKLYRYISIRCSFNVKFLFFRYRSISRLGLYVQNFNLKLKGFKKLKCKKYIMDRMSFIEEYYKKSINLKRFNHLRFFYNKYYARGLYYKLPSTFLTSFYFFNHLSYYTTLNKNLFLFFKKTTRMYLRYKNSVNFKRLELEDIIRKDVKHYYRNNPTVSSFRVISPLYNKKKKYLLKKIVKILLKSFFIKKLVKTILKKKLFKFDTCSLKFIKFKEVLKKKLIKVYKHRRKLNLKFKKSIRKLKKKIYKLNFKNNKLNIKNKVERLKLVKSKKKREFKKLFYIHFIEYGLIVN